MLSWAIFNQPHAPPALSRPHSPLICHPYVPFSLLVGLVLGVFKACVPATNCHSWTGMEKHHNRTDKLWVLEPSCLRTQNSCSFAEVSFQTWRYKISLTFLYIRSLLPWAVRPDRGTTATRSPAASPARNHFNVDKRLPGNAWMCDSWRKEHQPRSFHPPRCASLLTFHVTTVCALKVLRKT